ncbi:MAG: T9SS type A sorting domain-containing protein [Saprospiraceae bacterium]|nr:T9SS type A sorting domain-containing protein [Saprospiraceae bacterium]
MKQLLLVFFFLLGGLALSAQQTTNQKPELAVYPNPVIDNFTIHDNNDNVTEVTVFNLIGKKVKSFEHLKGEYHYVGDLPKGVYLVQMLDKSKRIITTQKMDKRS